MKNRFNKIRYKIILTYLLSAIFAGVSIILLSFISLIALNNKIYYLLHWLNSHIIAIPLFLLAILLIFFVLMSVFFLKLTQSSANYLEEITNTLKIISNGNLDKTIPIKTKDELGELAQIINTMTIKLNSLLEEERSWERTKNELITNISHDLRTPLTSILGYVELISKEKDLDKIKLQKYTEIIHEKCIQLNNLIHDLFEYTKIANREMVINKTSINLGELIDQVILGFIPKLEENKMEYRIISCERKVIMLADPILLVRLFDNLISNAINYGKYGKYLDLELLKESNEAIIKIINYGQDIPEEDLPYIFERLYRVDKSRSTKSGGTGLGLAIVKSIVDIHNGKVNVTSKDGKTIFEVRLTLS